MRGLVLTGVAVMAALVSASPAAGAGPAMVDAGGYDTCSAAAGVVRCWGGSFGSAPKRITGIPADDGTPATHIRVLSVGSGAACVLQGTTVRCWSQSAARFAIDPEMSTTNAAVVPGFAQPTDLSVGGAAGPICAVGDDRRVRCITTEGRLGQLGNGTTTTSSVPVVVSNLVNVKRVSAGDRHACAIHGTGNVSCWGGNDMRQIVYAGYWDTSPHSVPEALPIADAVSVEAGPTGTCAARRSGDVFCWGHNARSEYLGGPMGDRFATVEGITDANSLGVGLENGCGSSTGRAYCWGRNEEGQAGIGAVTNEGGYYRGVPPTKVDGLPEVSTVTTGTLHTCALTDDGVWCWGRNSSGELGDPALAAARSVVPRKVPGSGEWTGQVDGIIDTKGPFSQIQTTRDLRCGRLGERLMFGLLRPVFFRPVSCGTWVRSGGTVFGPANGGLEAPWRRSERSWVPVAQSESGSGTADDPWRIETMVRGGDLEVTQNDRYVDGAELTRTTLTIENTADSVRGLTAYFGGDCLIGDGSVALGMPEYGWQSKDDFLSNATGCATSPYNGHAVTLDAVEDSERRTDSYSYAGDTPAVVAGQIGSEKLSEQTLTGIEMDAAGLVATKTALAPGEKVVLRYHTRYGTTDAKNAAPEPVPAPGTGGEGEPADPVGVPWNMLAIGAPAAWAKGATGKGQTIAVIDTGVDRSDPWIDGVAAEACWTTAAAPLVGGNCANRRSEKVAIPTVGSRDPSTTAVRWVQRVAGTIAGAGASDPGGYVCTSVWILGQQCQEDLGGEDFADAVYQGTVVAGIAGGRRTGGAVAPEASVVAANTASQFSGHRPFLANPTDTAKALEWVDRMRSTRRIAAVNLMLPGRHYQSDRSGYASGTCTGQSPRLERAVDSLISHRIPVVVAAGDDRDKRRLPWPACLPGVISVGATNDSDHVSPASNSSRQLTLLAPGIRVLGPTRSFRLLASLPFFGLEYRDGDYSGTFAAAAHVTGAIALYKQKNPRATPAEIRNRLRSTGITTTDTANNRKTPRLRVDRLLNAGFPSD